MFIVEELDDLLGDCSLDVASAVGRNDEDVGLIDVKESVAGEKWDSLSGESEFFHETAGIARRRREVDDVDHMVFSFHEAAPGQGAKSDPVPRFAWGTGWVAFRR